MTSRDQTNPSLRYEMSFFAETDGFVFVVDPRAVRQEASLYALEVFRRDLVQSGRHIDELPIAFLLNQEFGEADLSESGMEAYRAKRSRLFATDAETGEGVMESITWLLDVIDETEVVSDYF